MSLTGQTQNVGQVMIRFKEVVLNRERALQISGIILTVVIVLFLVKTFVSNWNAIEPYLESFEANWFIFSVFAYGLSVIFVGYNWVDISWNMDPCITKTKYMDIHMTSAMARYMPGGIWNIVGKAYLCGKNGVSKSASSAAIVLEYVFQIISSGIYMFLFLLILMYQAHGLIGAFGVTIVLILFIGLIPNIIRLGVKIVCRLWKSNDFGTSISNSYVYVIVLKYCAAWFVVGLAIVIMVKAFANVDLKQGILLIVSYPVAWCAGFLSPTPNGLGVREAIQGALLSSRFEYELVLLIIMSSRIWTILGEVGAFMLFKLYYIISYKEREQN